jgi:hypothetical protein
MQGGSLLSQPRELGSQVFAPLLFGAAVGALTLKNGKHLVDAPQLRPDLTHPW